MEATEDVKFLLVFVVIKTGILTQTTMYFGTMTKCFFVPKPDQSVSNVF